MNKKIVGIIICILFLISVLPIIQGAYTAETMNDNSNIHIDINKGCKYENFLKKYMGCDIEVHNSGDGLIPVNITIVLDSYDLNGKNLNWTYTYNGIHYLGWENSHSSMSFRWHLSFSVYQLKISFIKMDVTANEEKLTKIGLRIGDYILFLI